MNKDKLISLNHRCTITAVIIAKMIPFKIPIINSFPTTRLKLLVDNGEFIKKLGWEPKVSIEERIDQVVKWTLKNERWLLVSKS